MYFHLTQCIIYMHRGHILNPPLMMESKSLNATQSLNSIYKHIKLMSAHPENRKQTKKKHLNIKTDKSHFLNFKVETRRGLR